MKHQNILLMYLLIAACCALSEEAKISLIGESGRESELTITDHSSTNETLYSRLNAGELIFWQYGATNVTSVTAGSTSVSSKRVQIIEVYPAYKEARLDYESEQVRTECFMPAMLVLDGASYTPNSIAKHWAEAWTRGTYAPQGALVWKNF